MNLRFSDNWIYCCLIDTLYLFSINSERHRFNNNSVLDHLSTKSFLHHGIINSVLHLFIISSALDQVSFFYFVHLFSTKKMLDHISINSVQLQLLSLNQTI